MGHSRRFGPLAGCPLFPSKRPNWRPVRTVEKCQAWILDSLFNARTGYAHPSNTYLANETGIAVNKVQEALAELEAGGAIVRVVMTGHPQQLGVQNLRRIIPRSQLAYAQAAAALRDRKAALAEAPDDRLGGGPLPAPAPLPAGGVVEQAATPSREASRPQQGEGRRRRRKPRPCSTTATR